MRGWPDLFHASAVARGWFGEAGVPIVPPTKAGGLFGPTAVAAGATPDDDAGSQQDGERAPKLPRGAPAAAANPRRSMGAQQPLCCMRQSDRML